MGRRTSSGFVGTGGNLGAIVPTGAGNTLSTSALNQNLILDPNGSGLTQVVRIAEARGDGTNQGVIRFYNTANTQYSGFQQPASASNTVTYTLPDGAPAVNGYLLSSSTAGVLSWIATPSTGLTFTNDTTTNSTFYPVITSSTANPVLAVNRSDTKLTFNPSSGTLFSTIGQFPDIIGNTAAASSGTASLTIRGTSSGTKNLGNGGSIAMTDGVPSSTTLTGTLVVTGGVGISGQLTAATLVETSSVRFKENIEPIKDALSKILNLNGVIYDRKDESSLREAGLIAENVNEHIPNVVTKDDEGNVYGLQYTKLVAYLVEAVKTLKTELDELKLRTA